MLIVFDVDGTLIGGEEADWTSFTGAIASVLGICPPPAVLLAQPEVTAQAIAEASVRYAGRECGAGLEQQICDEFLRHLKTAHSTSPLAFRPLPGVLNLLNHLSSPSEVSVALATGDWLPTISFKLGVAGIAFSHYPIATSSDCRCRSDIIRLAVQRSGRALSDAVYVGDGVWDYRACEFLGIPFIGAGTRTEFLRQAGARHLHPEIETHAFLASAHAALSSPLVVDHSRQNLK